MADQNINSNELSKNESLQAVNENLNKALKEIQEIKERQGINSHEINILQTESVKKKRRLDFPSIIALFALLISGISTIYPIMKEKSQSVEAYRSRAKEIVRRLTEIQTMLNTSGFNFNAIQQSTINETSNLVDEAIEISDRDKNLLTVNEYSVVANIAININRMERIPDLVERGLDLSSGLISNNSFHNYLATYYFRNGNKKNARERILLAIDATKKSNSQFIEKQSALAFEYYYWSSMEYYGGEFSKADSLLRESENLVIKNVDSKKFEYDPTTNLIKNSRIFYDSLKKLEPLNSNLKSAGQ